MIIKILGILIVISSTSYAGFYFSNVELYKINDLNQMKKALTILKSEIEFIGTPLPEALFNISSRVKKPINSIFLKLYEKLNEKATDGISKLWTFSLEHHRKQTFFDDEDMDSFISFGKTLGYLDKNMQLNTIDQTVGYIDQKIAMLQECKNKNKKMFLSLGVLSGLLVVVILL